MSGLGNIKSERKESSDESESESESESDVSTRNNRSGETSSSESEIDIKQEKQLHDRTSDSENVNFDNIKKEKDVKQITTSAFIPRPIKLEPQSDTEGTPIFKTPTSNYYNPTIKIKHEPVSEDESVKRKKSKTAQNSKSLRSIEKDLFDSFLK